MKKEIFIFLLVLVFANTFAQKPIYAFVGKKIEILAVPSENSFYMKYKNTYKVEENIHNEIEKDTVVFYSYTHLNQIKYSIYDYVILYLSKNEKDEYLHLRTYFTPIFTRKDNQWLGFRIDDNKIDEGKLVPVNKHVSIKKNLQIMQTLYPEVSKVRNLITAFYPSYFFTYRRSDVVAAKKLLNAHELCKMEFKENNWQY